MIQFCHNMLGDDATLTASSEASGYDKENAVDDRLAKKWRTTDDTSEWFKFDLGTSQSIGAFYVFGHNITTGATVKLQGNDTDSWGSPSYDETLTVTKENIVDYPGLAVGGSVMNRYWRLLVEDPSNPDGYIEIGRIILGTRFTPTQNFTYGFHKQRVDPSEKTESEGQDLYSYKKDKYKLWEFEITQMEDTDRDEFVAMFDAIGSTEPFCLTIDPDNQLNTSSMYALWDNPFDETLLSSVPTYVMTFTFKEII